MNHGCPDEGALRLLIDGAGDQAARAADREHLAGCAACAARLEQLRANAAQAARLLAHPPLSPSDTKAAAARARAALPQRAPFSGATRQRSPHMTISRAWRRAISAAAAAAIAVALLALPPVQAAADQLLRIFRVQAVVFVPVTQSRMAELEKLNFDESTLFVAEPKVVSDAGEPRAAASAEEASSLAGYGVAQPTLPSAPASAEHRVTGRSSYSFQVNVDSARQLLLLAGVDDVTLPNELGSSPITADVGPVVMSSYTGDGYDLTLVQGQSPEVSVPEGVDLSQMGRALLRLLGSSPAQADELSRQIDWSTTFVFPFPADLSDVQTVQFGGTTGLLVESRGDGARSQQLYWQRGDRFFVLESRGATERAVLLSIAESVR